ncbi:cysteine proteinase inhibitor 6-like [Solanum dulcamara]|uniref:cysteine proteinase inhibitor 6-like n=1 Tax=Solanum dulcamara TaxID=45834 RepID=UPI002484FD06|nr:cysteine proteinase inhibitor 6-like [Solanum dulcamara]
MAFIFNSPRLATLSMIVISFTFCNAFVADDDQNLLDSFKYARNTVASSPSHDEWQPIQNINDLKVIEIAKFAVNTENSLLEGVQLEFGSVSDGRFKVDNNGITYDLTIVSIEFDEANEYEAVVFENSKDNVRKLISFD